MNDIKNAFSELEPDKETADRLYNKILSSSYAPAFKTKKKKIWLTKRNATIIACAGILVAGTIVSTCSALVLNVNKKNRDKQETTTESIYEEKTESTAVSEETDALTSENEKIEKKEEQTEAQTETKIPEETKVSDKIEKVEKVTVNGRDYIVVTTEKETKKDNKLHATNKDIIPAVTEKTEKTAVTKKETKKSTAVSTVKTSATFFKSTAGTTEPKGSLAPVITEEERETVAETIPATAPVATTVVNSTTVRNTKATAVVTTVRTTTKVENSEATENTSPETSPAVSPWNYTVVTYNGQNYYFGEKQVSDESIQHYLGPYRIYNRNMTDYITEDVYFIDDNNVAVEINSVLYIYSK